VCGRAAAGAADHRGEDQPQRAGPAPQGIQQGPAWSPQLPVETRTAELIGYGRVAWDVVTGMLDGAEAAFADYSGFHIGPPPDTPPPYTHLWAWTSQWLARVRIDGQTAIIGILALTGEPDPAPPAQSREAVHYQCARARTWPHSEKRVGQLPADLADRNIDIYLIAGDHPVTFVAPSEHPIARLSHAP
jgi:hypothetical protein